jgi:ankyrin repeat protein
MPGESQSIAQGGVQKMVGFWDWFLKRAGYWDNKLLEAAKNGDLIKVQTLLEKGANPNAEDDAGLTPLHYAADLGYVEIVKLLLERGADPKAKDNKGSTPLHWAAFFGHVDVVRVLLERGADPRIADNEGHIPLDYAKDSAIRSLLESALRNNKLRNGKRLQSG